MSRFFDFRSPKQKLQDEIKSLWQEIKQDKDGKRTYFNNPSVRFPRYPDDSIRKTDEQLDEEWKKLYLYKDFD